MPSKYTGTDQEKSALNAYICLLRAADALTSRVSQNLKAYNITLPQITLMECIYYLGPMKTGEISKKMVKTGGNITMIIDNLEKRKWVKRCKIPEDRRAFKIQLTKEGERIFKKVMPMHVRDIEKEMSVLNRKELKLLRDLTRRVGLSDQGEG